MKKLYFLLLLFCALLSTKAQVTYTANGGSGFGGPIGNSSMTISHDATNITITVDRAGDLGSNNMVMYIDTGATGRAVINGDVNDDGDGGRKAVSKFGSGDLNFPPGFEASYAIYGDTGFMGMFGIPATGIVGNNGLNFISGVGNATADPFVLTVSWAQLGLTSTDSFSFVVTYGNPLDPSGNMFSSNEGYGDGILNGGNNIAFDAMTYTTYYEYPSGDKHGIASTSGTTTLWSLDSSWANGNLPSSDDEIIIAHDMNMDVDVTVSQSLTVNQGVNTKVLSNHTFTLNGTLNTNSPAGNFIFNSDSNGSAQFLNGPSAILNGEVTVNRFIPTGSTSQRRAFRFITSAVNSTTNIYENWQNNGLSTAGIGTQITGSTTGANGFDATSSGNPSLFIYEEDPNPSVSTYSFQAVTATNTTGAAGYIKAGKAYNLFVRGDRNYDLTTAPNTPNADVTIPTLGSLELASTVNSGVLNPNASGFSFVGNPYQATVNMSTVTKNNVNPNFVYVWNPNLATKGAYETIALTGNGQLSDKRFIQPGQAFFVQTIAAGASSLDFNATDKVVAQNTVGLFSTPNNRPLIELSLYRDLNGTATNFDQLSIFLDGNNAVDLNDAAKIENFEESLSRDFNGILLSLENRAMPTHNEIIPLNFKNIAANAYTLSIDVNSLTTGLEAILHDNFLNTDTILTDGSNVVNLSFDLNNPLSIDAARFELKFVDSTLSTEIMNDFTFSIFPNPSINGQVTLTGDFSQENTTATFYNTLGQQVLKTAIYSNEATVNLQNLDAGIYLVNIISGDQSVTQKLVIK